MSERTGKFCDLDCDQLAAGICQLCQRDFCKAHDSSLTLRLTARDNSALGFGSINVYVCYDCRLRGSSQPENADLMPRLVETLTTILKADLAKKRLTPRTP
jgi:hypothetical protein